VAEREGKVLVEKVAEKLAHPERIITILSSIVT
jgi:hypothetical protein